MTLHAIEGMFPSSPSQTIWSEAAERHQFCLLCFYLSQAQSAWGILAVLDYKNYIPTLLPAAALFLYQVEI